MPTVIYAVSDSAYWVSSIIFMVIFEAAAVPGREKYGLQRTYCVQKQMPIRPASSHGLGTTT